MDEMKFVLMYYEIKIFLGLSTRKKIKSHFVLPQVWTWFPNTKSNRKYLLTLKGIFTGNVLLVNNWRVMHGRTSFLGNERVMSGCYVNKEALESKARVLRII